MFDILYLTGPDGFKDDIRDLKYIPLVWGIFALLKAIFFNVAYAEVLNQGVYDELDGFFKFALNFGATAPHWANAFLMGAMTTDLWIRE